ncbi:MAG: glycoside hydrolase family 3 C-terminal domain-containing protein, partial [Acidobacteriaceae bacterium]
MKSICRVLAVVCVLATMSVSTLWAQYKYPFQNPNLPTEQRITDLLSRMTLDEKIECLSSHPGVPRLDVVGSAHIEGLHGVALGGPGGWEGKDKSGKHLQKLPTTQFPQAKGLGNTWDPALIEQAAAEEGLEARYDFQSPKYHRGGIVVRAPNADLSRDPRWGRSEESYGEDPYLVGTLAVSFVKGLQGNDPKYWLTSSLLKHFLANSNEDGRGGSSSNFDDRLFHEYYAVPFRMGIEQGGANAFMTAYNAWNQIPMAAQPVLRSAVMQRWGFDGILCTDAGALTNMVTLHKYYPDMAHAAAGAIHAGINQFLDKYQQPVRDALHEQLITEGDIDQNLRGVFRVMIHLGLLDPPSMVPYSQIGKTDESVEPWNLPAAKLLARKVTDESIVLLKNMHKTLPLDKSKLKSIAVIGPYANIVALDWYSGTPPYAISPLEGIRNKVGGATKVSFDMGKDVAAALQDAKMADVAIVVVGNHPTCDAGWNVCKTPSNGKEAIDRKTIYLEQEALVKQVYAVNPHTVVVLISSFPYAINWTQAHVPAIVHMTHNSEEEGNALADVLFGDYDPAGRLSQTWPSSMDQLPPMMDYNIRHGRTYMYFKGKPLYAFGYGLSYTTFKYSHLAFSADRLKYDGNVTVSVKVMNTGKRAGDEVVQMYVRHLASQVQRPMEELKGFERIHLQAGESKIVKIELKAKDLAYWDDAKN